MASRKLTNWDRDGIISSAVAAAFDPRKAEIDKALGLAA
jgi:hypothetical protein